MHVYVHVHMIMPVCVFYHALYENIYEFLYVLFVCLYTTYLYVGICCLHVFL